MQMVVMALFHTPNPVTSSVACLQVDPKGKQWNRLRASIGMPNFYEAEPEHIPEEMALA